MYVYACCFMRRFLKLNLRKRVDFKINVKPMDSSLNVIAVENRNTEVCCVALYHSRTHTDTGVYTLKKPQNNDNYDEMSKADLITEMKKKDIANKMLQCAV